MFDIKFIMAGGGIGVNCYYGVNRIVLVPALAALRSLPGPCPSARVFRVYRGTPPHYHANSDEYLYVLSGRGTFWMEDVGDQAEFGPGDLLFFRRGVVHALPDLLEKPVVFFSVDAPRRDPGDVIVVNPGDGTPESFIQAQR
jgi:mannose-6-phosphate isomerase-like protein (cupin superfamily)